VELACREIEKKCVAVTGTNGKTTVTLLTTHVLQSAGIKARALGNIGVPLTAAVDELESTQAEVFVIELSSFQLETMKTKFIDAGVILNITPDHLDRYFSVQEYAAAKIGMEKNLKDDGVLFVERKCLDVYGALFSSNHHLSYGYDSQDHLHCSLQGMSCNKKLLWDAAELNRVIRPEKEDTAGLQKSHHLENIMAAYGLCSTFSITPQQFLAGLASFQKPAHRIEFVRSLDGVNYYDDSKGTNIDAVIRAVEELDGDIILIAGGVDKGFPYTPWIDPFKDKVKAICAIGQAKEKIQNDLKESIPVICFDGFKDAITHAVGLARKGDCVLLSPGCSSFDMFKDYAHRGQEFQRIVNSL
jgi:UDP-N-acetylmuramoylalanine--D-glutamate ligase